MSLEEVVGWERRNENKRNEVLPSSRNGGHSKLQLTGLVKKKIYIASTKDVGGSFPQSSSICDYVIMEE